MNNSIKQNALLIKDLFDDKIQKIHYKETEHYQQTKNFLESPERYFQHLFEDL